MDNLTCLIRVHVVPSTVAGGRIHAILPPSKGQRMQFLSCTDPQGNCHPLQASVYNDEQVCKFSLE